MSAPRVVAVLFGSGSDSTARAALDTELSLLERDLQSADGRVELRVIARGMTSSPFDGADFIDVGSAPPGPVDRLLRALGGHRLRAALARVPVGRLLNSMGPLDPGRVFWRAVRRHPAARAALRGADAAYAADLAAVTTAWIAVRRGWVREARYDHRASALRS